MNTISPAPNALLALPAPAKLNLFLHVVGQREDGYHLLESVFTLISLYDQIDLVARHDAKIIRHGDCVGPADLDLCVKAAQLLQKHCNCHLGVDISVTKNIPSGAGLGGGSSDAATTLIGLNRLWGLNLSRKELINLGLKLGADVPFFIFGQTAFVTGIGEVISPFPFRKETFNIVWPNIHLCTKKIFSHLNLTSLSKSGKILNSLDGTTYENMMAITRNDLEIVVRKNESRMKSVFDFFASFSNVRMTGSGSSIFFSHPMGKREKNLLESLPNGWLHFVAETIERHPLSKWIKD